MKCKRLFFVFWLVVVAFSSTGNVFAEDEDSNRDGQLSDEQYCEREAIQAGMINDEDIEEYIRQCLGEINQHDESEQSDGRHRNDMGN